MSKRPDEDAPDMEAGMTTAERRRRRRRGGGLRVPSDNVPRRNAAAPAPVTPPVPEDPNLAVSIAYSFKSDDSGPLQRPDTDLPTGEVGRLDTEVTGDGPDIGDIIMAPEPVNTLVEVDEDDEDDDGGDGEFEAKTREMTAVDLAELGLEDPSEPRAPLARPSNPGMPAMAGDDEPTVLAAASAPPIGRSAAVSTPPPTPPPKSRVASVQVPVTPAPDTDEEDEDDDVEIDVDDEDRDDEDEPTSFKPPVKPADARAAAAQPAPAPAAAKGTGPAKPAAPAAAKPAEEPVRPARAATVALSDDDLEELMEENRSGRVKEPGRVNQTMPIAEIDLEEIRDRASTPRLARATGDESGEIEVDVVEEIDSGQIAAPVRPNGSGAAATAAAAKPATTSQPNAAATSAAVNRPPPTPAGHVTATPPPGTAPAPAATATPAPVVAKAPPPAPAPAKKPAAPPSAAVVASVVPAIDQKRPKRGKPWFEEIFDEDYLRTLPFLTPQATQTEAQFVIDALSVQPGAQLLDLGCGYGRHSMELAARGFHLVGLDLSLPLLLRGADEAQRRGLSINFVHADMRELDFEAQFDGVFCLFSTFGYFDDETNKKTAANVARALKPGGRCVIEVLNRDYVIAELPTRVWWEGDGCVVLEEVEFNYFSSRIHSNRSVVFDDGRQIEQEISVRAYSLHELGKLLHAAGFRVVEVSGSVHTRGRYFGNQSRHIIVVAEKKAKDDTSKSS